MVRISFLFILILGSQIALSQNDKIQYDSVLAKSLGADDRGMKSYIFAILKTGGANIEDKAVLDSLFKGHFKNINSLADSGYLVVAGPYGKNELGYRGLFILNTDSKEQAIQWIERDPTVRAKYFEVEYIPWYGTAALNAVNPIHKKISKKKFE
ncbi:MAG TPA: YciI family protein [Bacteroidales bacterium]|nr:YciI family protein [Bacteroidales bacterium]